MVRATLGSDPTHVYVANILSNKITREKRTIVQQLNLGITDICLLSKAGAEGTDFKSTRESEMYICSTDKRAVAADIIQFRGRLNRFKSHDVCPKEFRNVSYNRICLFKDIKVEEDDSKQTLRMSHFFYYKVPRNNYAIFFHAKHKREAEANPNLVNTKMCPFCYINNKDSKFQTLDNYNKCQKCNAISKKALYYLEDSFKNKWPRYIIVNDDFKKYEQLLFRLQRYTLLELLLKTQSIEFLDFATCASDRNDSKEKNIMVINKLQDKQYLHLSNI